MCQVKAKCYGNCALWHNLEGLLSRSSLKVIKDSYGPTTKKPLQKSCLVSFASETVVQNYLRGQFSFESARNKTYCKKSENCILKKKFVLDWNPSAISLISPSVSLLQHHSIPQQLNLLIQFTLTTRTVAEKCIHQDWSKSSHLIWLAVSSDVLTSVTTLCWARIWTRQSTPRTSYTSGKASVTFCAMKWDTLPLDLTFSRHILSKEVMANVVN